MKQVEILGSRRLRVKDNAVAPDDQVFNAMGMEVGYKVFVVLVHPVRSSRLLSRKRYD